MFTAAKMVVMIKKKDGSTETTPTSKETSTTQGTPTPTSTGHPTATTRVYLSSTVKNFIVRCAACGDVSSEIVARVKEEFGITVSRQQVMRYDPRTESGSHLSAGLLELYRVTREKFLSELETIDSAHREIRLRRLDMLYAEAVKAGQWKTATVILAECRKQMADLMPVDEPEEGV
jgi:hypothetical protein